MRNTVLWVFLLGVVISLSAQVDPRAKAKSVILIYLDGGPSQLDMFDPKPLAGKDYYGKYKEPIETNVKGVYIGEKLPRLAQLADKYSIIRSMTHNVFGHETANYAMLTADLTGREIVYPSFGAVIAYRTRESYKGLLPPYISLTSASSRFNDSGFLGPQYKSFDTGGAPDSKFFNVEGIVNQGVTPAVIERKKAFSQSLQRLSPIQKLSDEEKRYEEMTDQNYQLLLGSSKEVFDLTQESTQTRERYGMNAFGQSCLVAKRLVAAGVPFVNVRYTGWDTHKEHFAKMDERLEITDRGVSALLEDLSASGALEHTIVLVGGEFGRTPKLMFEPPWNGGRGHYGAAFSYLVAGGGFKGGVVIGETDAKGEKVIKRPVYPADLIGTVYQLMGIDPHSTLPHPLYQTVPILPSLGKPGQSEGLLIELMTSPKGK